MALRGLYSWWAHSGLQAKATSASYAPASRCSQAAVWPDPRWRGSPLERQGCQHGHILLSVTIILPMPRGLWTSRTGTGMGTGVCGQPGWGALLNPACPAWLEALVSWGGQALSPGRGPGHGSSQQGDSGTYRQDTLCPPSPLQGNHSSPGLLGWRRRDGVGGWAEMAWPS